MSGRKDMPLRARIVQNVLTIEIGVGTNAFAALRAPFLWDEKCDRPELRYAITDARSFGVDVCRELTREEEDGSSLLTNLFDEAIRKAIEDGSEFFLDKQDESDERNKPKPTKRSK